MAHEPTHHHDILADIAPAARELRAAIPDVWTGFNKLHEAAFAPGALSVRTKELIALTLSIVKRCDGCIAAHARGAARSGASEAEVAEAIGVAISMDGGPATTDGPRAFEAFKEFKAVYDARA